MSDCVPYAIHTATGIDFDLVLAAAAQCGWSENNGMTSVAGWCVMRELGIGVSQAKILCPRITLATFLRQADPTKTYIVSLIDHWLTVQHGRVIEKPMTAPRRLVEHYFEVNA